MRSKRLVSLVTLSAVIGLAAILILLAVRARQHSETTITVLASKRAELLKAISIAEKRLSVAETVQTELGNAVLRATTALNPKAKQATPPKPLRTMSEINSIDPRLEALELERQRLAFYAEYRHFMHLEQLSPAQVKRWEELSLERTESWMDLATVGRAQDEAGQQTTAKLQQQAKEEYNAAVATLLGASAYQRLQEFERTIPLRNVVVRGLAGAAALEGIPLSAQQGEQLMQALIASGGADVRGINQDLATVDWNAVEAQAQGILSPQQFALFISSAPSTSFTSRWQSQLDRALLQAKDADAAARGEHPRKASE